MIAVVTSGKGGVGKSTVCLGLSSSLAAMGQRVLVIDTDAELRSLDILFGLTDNTVYDLSDIFAGRCTPSEAIVASPLFENVSVIAAPPSTEAIPAPEDMQYLCRGLAEHYDTILIDCPAGIGRGFQSAVAAADRAIIVATPDAVCARDAYIASSKLDRIGVSYKMIINRLRPRAVMKGQMPDIDEVMDIAQVPLLGVIPEDEAVTLATANGKPLNKKSYAAACFNNIAARFCGEAVPLGRIDKMV